MDSDTFRFLRNKYSDLLAGNDTVASETELNQWKAALSGWQAKVQDINKTAEILRLTLATLLKQKEEIEKSISHFYPIFSPIRRVPDDVWGEIFYHCLPSHRNPIPITSEAPLVLTLVCQRWRRVAFSSPWIWTKLHFSFQSCVTDKKYDPHGVFNRQWQPRMNSIRSWLSRSRNLPLSISLRCVVAGTIRKESDHVEREAMQIIIDHASHWRDLEICMVRESFSTLYNMIDISPTTVPILRSLKLAEKYRPGCQFIEAPHYQLPTIEQHPLRNWFSLPTLRNVHVDRLFQNGEPPLIAIRCSHLSSLSLYTSSKSNDIVNVLRACPLLEECYLTFLYYNRSERTSDSMISLPNLKRLWIKAALGDEDCLWAELDTPSLVELTLYHVEYDPHSKHAPSLSSFLLRCKSLDKITIDPTTLHHGDLESILTSIPTVSHLQVDQAHCRKQRPHRLHSKTAKSTTLTEVLMRLEELAEEGYPSRITALSAHVSFIIYRTPWDDTATDDPEVLLWCLEKYIRPLSPVDSPQCYPSLDSVTLVIEGHPQLAEYYNNAIDIASETVKHAESVGRTVGKDLFLDITYPWKESYEKLKRTEGHCKKPDPFVPAKEGLDNDMDLTWAYVGV